MYIKLVQILMLVLVAMVLLEGVPEFADTIHNAIPSDRHSAQYNLAFWLLTLIVAFALLKNSKRNTLP